MTLFKINAGKYRHPIIIQELVENQNEFGEMTSDWQDFKKVKAGIFPFTAKELMTSESIVNEASHKVHIRYIDGVTAEQRIMFGNRIFQIVSSPIDFQFMHKELQLLCKEVFA